MCSILKSLEEDTSLLPNWFENNYMKMNGSKGEDVSVRISGSFIQESDEGISKITLAIFVRKLAKSYMH